MWAVCRKDHGLTWPEFTGLTLAQYEALEERRVIAIRRARFDAALVACVTYNAHRGTDNEALEPWDFLPGFERDPEEEERDKTRRSIKQAIKVAFTEMRFPTPESAQAEKARMIARMTANGVEDPEQLIREVFPDL